jgi:hypothetical protein
MENILAFIAFHLLSSADSLQEVCHCHERPETNTLLAQQIPLAQAFGWPVGESSGVNGQKAQNYNIVIVLVSIYIYVIFQTKERIASDCRPGGIS